MPPGHARGSAVAAWVAEVGLVVVGGATGEHGETATAVR